MKKILDFFRKPGIPNPPWDYDFIYNLDESEYPKYLEKIFKLNTSEDIDLTPPRNNFPPYGGGLGRGFVSRRSNSALLTPFPLRVLPPKRGQKGLETFNQPVGQASACRIFRCRHDSLKTFNQKIQWLKLYDVTPLKKLCTDKVTVRDYVKEKIGEEYLKPAL